MRTERNPANTLKMLMVVVAMAGNVDLSIRQLQIQNLVKQNSEWIF